MFAQCLLVGLGPSSGKLHQPHDVAVSLLRQSFDQHETPVVVAEYGCFHFVRWISYPESTLAQARHTLSLWPASMVHFNASWAPPGEPPALLSAERSSLDGTPLSCVAYGPLSPCSPMRPSYHYSQECCFCCFYSVLMYCCKRTTGKRSDVGGCLPTYPSSSVWPLLPSVRS